MTADQLVQMDTTTIEDKLAKLASGVGGPIWGGNVDKDGKPVGAEPMSEGDENAIVDNYKRGDENMAEIGKALREGRRIRFKPDDGKKKKKKKGDATSAGAAHRLRLETSPPPLPLWCCGASPACL